MIVLTFHGVGPVSRQLEPGEDQVWCTVGVLLGVLDAVGETDAVEITFDDGNASDYEIAFPALRERDMTATFNVVAGRLDEPGFLTTRQVHEMHEAGMTIGSHGMRHRPWRRLDDAALDEETVVARARLGEVVGTDVRVAACPFGEYDRRVLRALRAAGFERVLTSDRATAAPDAWLVPRFSVCAGDSAADVERLMLTRLDEGRRIGASLRMLAKSLR